MEPVSTVTKDRKRRVGQVQVLVLVEMVVGWLSFAVQD
jgi:hypothetical protein